MANDLCVDIEALADGNHPFSHLRTYIDFHAVTHVEDLIHFAPVGAGALMDGAEQRRHGEHIVFYNMAVVADEVEHLGLGTTRAMHHTVNLGAQLIEQPLDNRSVGAGGGEYQLAGIDRSTFDSIGQAILTALYKVVRDGVVVALGVVLSQVLGKHIVTG